MARRSFTGRARRFASRAYGRTRTIVQRVYSRRRSSGGFLKKNKTMLIIGALAVAGFYFKDKIKAMLTK